MELPKSVGLILTKICNCIYYKIVIWCGAVAQLGERDNRTVEVRGSSPLSSTKVNTGNKWK